MTRARPPSPSVDTEQRGPISDSVIDVLRDHDAEWTMRLGALQQLVKEAIDVPAHTMSAEYRALLQQFRILAPLFSSLISDLRSTLVREACIVLEKLAEVHGSSFVSSVDQHVVPTLLKRTSTSKAVIRDSANDAAAALFRHGLSGVSDVTAQQLSNVIKDRKSAVMTRSAAAVLLGMFLTDENNVLSSAIQEALQQAIIAGVTDPDQEVRSVSRNNWLSLAKINEKAALALLLKLPPQAVGTLRESFDQYIQCHVPSEAAIPLQVIDRPSTISRSPRRGLEFSLHPTSENVLPIAELLPLSDGQQHTTNPSRLHAPVRSSQDIRKISSFHQSSQPSNKPSKLSRPFNRPPRRSVAPGSLIKPLTLPSAGPSENLKIPSEVKKPLQVNVAGSTVKDLNATGRISRADNETASLYLKNLSHVKAETSVTTTSGTSLSPEPSKHNPPNTSHLLSSSPPGSISAIRTDEVIKECTSSSLSDPSVFKSGSAILDPHPIRKSTSFPGSKANILEIDLYPTDLTTSNHHISTKSETSLVEASSVEDLSVIMTSPTEIVTQSKDSNLIESASNCNLRDKSGTSSEISRTLNHPWTVEANSCVSLEAHDQTPTSSQTSCSSTRKTNSVVHQHNLTPRSPFYEKSSEQDSSVSKDTQNNVLKEHVSLFAGLGKESCSISTDSNFDNLVDKVASPPMLEESDIVQTKDNLKQEPAGSKESTMKTSDQKPKSNMLETTSLGPSQVTIATTPEPFIPSDQENKGRLSYIIGLNITPVVPGHRHWARFDATSLTSPSMHDGGRRSGDIGLSVALDETELNADNKVLPTRGISVPDLDTDIESPSQPPQTLPEVENRNSVKQCNADEDLPKTSPCTTNPVEPNATAKTERDIIHLQEYEEKDTSLPSVESNVADNDTTRKEKSVEELAVMESSHGCSEITVEARTETSRQPPKSMLSSEGKPNKGSPESATLYKQTENAIRQASIKSKYSAHTPTAKAIEKENHIGPVGMKQPPVPSQARRKSHTKVPTNDSSKHVNLDPRKSLASSLQFRKVLSGDNGKGEISKIERMGERRTSVATTSKREAKNHTNRTLQSGKRTLRASSAIGSLFSGMGKPDESEEKRGAHSSRVRRMESYQSGSRLSVARPPTVHGKIRSTVVIPRDKSGSYLSQKSIKATASSSSLGVPRSNSLKSSCGLSSKSTGTIPGVQIESRSATQSQSVENTNDGNYESMTNGSCLESLRSSIVKLRGGRGDWRSRLVKMNDVKAGLEALSRSELNSSVAEECLSVIGEAMNDVHYKMTVLALDCLFLLLLRTEGDAGSSALQRLFTKRTDILRRVLQVCKENKEDVKLAGQRFFTSFEMQFAAEVQVGLLLRAMGIESVKNRSRVGSRLGTTTTSYSGGSADARVLEIGCVAIKKAFERAERCDGGFLWSGSTLEAILVGMSALSTDRRPQVRRAAEEVVQVVKRCLPEGAFELACRKFGLRLTTGNES